MSSSSNMSDPPTEEDASTYDLKSDPPTHEDVTDEKEQSSDHVQPHVPSDGPAPEPADSIDDPLQDKPAQDAANVARTESHDTADADTIPSTDPQSGETAPAEGDSSQQTLPSSQGASQTRTSWISNRRSASFRHSDDYAPEHIAFPSPAQPTPESSSSTRTLKRAHSFVRISTNEDGTARVVTDLDKSPSPPHPKTNPATFARAAIGLRRCYSAAGLNDRLAAASTAEERSPKIPRTSSNLGRSRDSRAWEFWCDPDSRYNTSLTTRAEQEGSGSAADAIGLLRANRKVLAKNQSRQNTPVMSRNRSSTTSSEKNGVKKSRGPMQRASTSFGRLQSKESKKELGSETEDLPQTESDKENWEPDQPHSRGPSGPTGSQRTRKILGENTEIMSQSSSLGAMLASERGKNGARKNSDPEQDEELRLFMNGDGLSGRSAVSSAEEAGCVEGLLKLSQGQWR